MIGSVKKALSLLTHVNQYGALSVQEAANMLASDRSSAYRLLETLAAYGYVCKPEGSIYYEPGLRMDTFHMNIPRHGEILGFVNPELKELADATDCTAHICALSFNGMRFIGHEFGKSALRISMRDGQPVHCTATGKAVLAFLPDYFRDELIDQCELKAFTANTITNKDALMAELTKVKNEGFAQDICELYEGIYCIAAPIYLRKSWPLYSLGLSATHPLDDERTVRRVIEDSAKLSEKLQGLIENNKWTNKIE